MCYFFGICSTFKIDCKNLNLQRFLDVVDVTKYEDNPRDNMHYYEILSDGCACQLFRKRNCIISGDISGANQIHDDYSSDIKNFIDKLPGNGETEILVLLAVSDENYSISKDYELMRCIYPAKEISKQRFIDKYPFVEEGLIYLLK